MREKLRESGTTVPTIDGADRPQRNPSPSNIPVKISVVSPVYRAEPCLRELHRRLTRVLQEMGQSYEIILVEDCGPDHSWDLIKEIAGEDPRVRGIRLSRNFGQHMAIAAGLDAARGDSVLVIDCDLEDPPEAIPILMSKAAEGFDIVLARRRNRTVSPWRRWGSVVFFFLMRKFAGGYLEDGVGALSLISRQVIREYRRIADAHTHYLSVLHWAGFKSVYVDVEQAPRYAGKSSYSIAKLISHAIDGISSQSTRLLHLSIYGGFAFCIFSALQIVYLLYRKLVHSIGMDGWASIMAVLWFVGGAILFSLGITGLYLGRIFEQAKGRPLFIVRERTDAQD